MKTFNQFIAEEKSTADNKIVLLALEPKGSTLHVFDDKKVVITDKNNKTVTTKLIKDKDVLALAQDGYIEEKGTQTYVITKKGQKFVDMFV